MQFTNRQMHFALQLAIVLALGAFLAMAGPFGTYGDLAAVPRYAYWVGLCLFGYGSIAVAAQAMRALGATGGAASVALVALASALPTTLAVAWVEQLLRLDHAVPLQTMPRVYGSVAAIQLLMVLLLTRMRLTLEPLLFASPAASPGPIGSALRDMPGEAMHDLPAPGDAVSDVSAGPGVHEPGQAVPGEAAPPHVQARQASPPAFLARIPPHLGSVLLALQAEDHYLRVITDAGSALVLMRLADAIRELPPENGMQVHRSWWIAYEAAREIEKEAGRMNLRLPDGTQVPVSRTYQAAVKAARWPGLD